ncbi:MAG: glycosyltransferase family 25 protein [Pseudomonadota bacterium]
MTNIVVINLEREAARREHMTAALAGLDLPFKFIDAIDLQLVTDAYLARQVVDPDILDTIGRGMTCCFLSHRKAWNVAANAQEWTVILEDDVHFGEGTKFFLATTDWIPPGVEFVKLETFGQKVLVQRRGHHIGDRRLLRLASSHVGAAGYMITPRIAQRLLEESETIDWSIDKFLFDPAYPRLRDLVRWQLTPALCVQDSHLNKNLGFASALKADRASRPRPLQRKSKPPWVRLAGHISRLLLDRQRIEIAFQ